MPSPFSALSLLLELFESLPVLAVAVLAVREREVRSLPLCKGEFNGLKHKLNMQTYTPNLYQS